MLDKYFPLYAIVFFVTLSITVIAEKRLIPKLAKAAQQPIYTEGPEWHASKSGTPTMGGLAFLLSVSVALTLSSFFLFYTGNVEAGTSLAFATVYSLFNSLVGVIDDITKLKRKRNAGLSPIQKLALQFLFAVIFLFARAALLGDDTVIAFSFGAFDLGIFYYPICVILLLGIVNCANLTDGIDGLATSVAFSVGIVLFYLSASLFYDVAVIASALISAAVGFLLFNIHPAKIFMGDTGSLFFGALAVSAVFSMKNPLLSVLIGGVYVIEGASVILQVLYYKATKKRLFKMAPLHHHLEKCGMSENKICIIAILATFVTSIPAFIFYLP